MYSIPSEQYTGESHEGLSQDALGYIVENDVILQALSNKVNEESNIEIKRGVTLESIDHTQMKVSAMIKIN